MEYREVEPRFRRFWDNLSTEADTKNGTVVRMFSVVVAMPTSEADKDPDVEIIISR